MMTCRFCNQNKPLRNSHIIPEYFFRNYRDENGQPFVLINPQTPYQEKSSPKGFYEKLLCDTCEQHFNQHWETPGIDFFQMLADIEYRQIPQSTGRLAVVNDYNYSSLKLFFLSILWRASISKLDFFSTVKLGEFENSIYQLLQDNNPGDEEDFGVIIFKYAEFQDLEKIIAKPARFKNPINCYRITLNQYRVVIKVDKRNLPEKRKVVLLKPDPPLIILETDFENSKALTQMLQASELQEWRIRTFGRRKKPT